MIIIIIIMMDYIYTVLISALYILELKIITLQSKYVPKTFAVTSVTRFQLFSVDPSSAT